MEMTVKEDRMALPDPPKVEQLDPGIADVVIMLRNLGFNPTESGDGVSKPDVERDFDVKHVACAWEPPHGDGPNALEIGRTDFFVAADRLQNVLGAGWKVEASYDPADNSYVLLATKKDPPSPRHQKALDRFNMALGSARSSEIGSQLHHAGIEVYDALKHELGRR